MSLHLGLLQHLEYKRFRREVNVTLIDFLPSGYRGAGRGGRGRATYLFFFQRYFTLVIVYCLDIFKFKEARRLLWLPDIRFYMK